ncbi:DUF4405 domain-containing protein [Botrimarina hoheduenensis]|uniref:Flavinylation-associated cytochrome domain-containing protein n=1 Tax=Botrimarina hoheduenensis TaxID=2528000 RepID=A0A5C5WA74_9BACT|nr:DUF4405 domain-containing protein [Botrimarina hoheduenensis]TWT47788.1 hypothetical protein Pla111_14110 [Botrimarina hoheduenensis]
MTRTRWNATIDAAAFIEALALTSTGLLIWLRLPPGSGRGATIWSLDRHGWGEVHFWIAVATIATLLAHLAIHGKWIACVVNGRAEQGRGTRRLIAMLALFALLAFASTPMMVPLETAAHQPHERHSSDQTHSADGPVIVTRHASSIYGRTTLAKAAALTGESVDALAARLGLPTGVDGSIRLGPLAHKFFMTELEVPEATRDLPSGSHPLDRADTE